MINWLDRCHFGDVRDVLRRMIAAGVQVQTIVTSPPYWGLRSYLPEGHPDKALEIGSEPTIGEFIAAMVEVFDLCRQVLRDDGTCWVNMGDSYAGSRGGGVPSEASTLQGNGHVGGGPKLRAMTTSRRRDDAPIPRSDVRVDGLKPKDLVGQPWRLAFALQDAGWWLRQDIIWHKPNPMPESVRDRCTKAHEYIFLLSKSERYYYDFEAMQEPVGGNAHARRAMIKMPDGWDTGPGGHRSFHRAGREKGKYGPLTGRDSDGAHRTKANLNRKMTNGVGWGYADGEDAKPRTRNRRSVWTVPTEPYSGAHFATFPRALIEPCILAGCPPGGVVLDPFFGSGTTGQVAQQLGRRFIGIDINSANAPLQEDRLRCGMSLALEAA